MPIHPTISELENLVQPDAKGSNKKTLRANWKRQSSGEAPNRTFSPGPGSAQSGAACALYCCNAPPSSELGQQRRSCRAPAISGL